MKYAKYACISFSRNSHIDNITTEAARISGLIKGTLGWHASFQTKYLIIQLLKFCTRYLGKLSFSVVLGTLDSDPKNEFLCPSQFSGENSKKH